MHIKKVMIEICNSNKCTGCAACINVCPHNSISFETNCNGELHPYIDQSTCVDCKLCFNVCPNNVELEFRFPIKCFASWINDKEKRKTCASGGIGTILSEYVLQKKGVVFGSRYDDQMNPIMTWTESLADLEHFKGSRYVQSTVGIDTYKTVKKFLLENRLVLFIGTPCQISGLLCFLRKKYDNLITVDLICHGVSPSSYFTEELHYLCNKYKLPKMKNVRFRGNDGNNFFLTLWDKNIKRVFPRNDLFQKLLFTDKREQFYIKGFLLGVSMRENCYACNYARPERVSDITIGDFIGLGKKQPFPYPVGNVSSVTINTNKGDSFYETVSVETPSLQNIERQYSERLEYAPSLVHPFERHPKNSAFRELYPLWGFSKSIRFLLKEEMDNDWKNYTYRYYRNIPIRIVGKIKKYILK